MMRKISTDNIATATIVCSQCGSDDVVVCDVYRGWCKVLCRECCEKFKTEERDSWRKMIGDEFGNAELWNGGE